MHVHVHCNYIRDDISQGRIALAQPTTRSNTICLVLEFLGSHLIEVLETRQDKDGLLYKTMMKVYIANTVHMLKVS